MNVRVSCTIQILLAMSGCTVFRQVDSSQRYNQDFTIRDLHTEYVKTIQVYAPKSSSGRPHIADGEDLIFELSTEREIEAFIAKLHEIDDTDVFTPGAGHLFRAHLIDDAGSVSAKVWVSWSGYHVGVDVNDNLYSRVCRRFSLFAFELTLKHNPQYLYEVLRGVRPTIPTNYIIEHFPFPDEMLREFGKR